MNALHFEQLGAIAGACFHKEVDELTEEEKVALAVMAGCAYRMWHEGGKLRIDIINPIGFQKIDGRLRVCEGVARKGDTVIVTHNTGQAQK